MHDEEPIGEFRIQERRHGDAVVLTIHGDLDLATAGDVAARLEALRAAREPALLDLDELDFMDSSGLRMVLATAELSDATGWRFTLTHGSEQVRRLFESTRVTDRLPIVPRP
jgi:anti-sigma B factor antagonist